MLRQRTPSRLRPETSSTSNPVQDREWSEMLKRRQAYKNNLDRIKSELDDATKALQNIGKPSSSVHTGVAIDKDYDWKYNNPQCIISNGSEKSLTRFTVDKEILAQYPTPTSTAYQDSNRNYINGNSSASKLCISNSSSNISGISSTSKLSISNSNSNINGNSSASKLSISNSNFNGISGICSAPKLSISNSISNISGISSAPKLSTSYNNSSTERSIERPPVPSRWTGMSREGVETRIAQKIVDEPSSRRQIDSSSSRQPPPPLSPSVSTHTTFLPTKLTANQLNQVSQSLTREETRFTTSALTATTTTATTYPKATSGSRQPNNGLRPGTTDVEQFTSIQQQQQLDFNVLLLL